jgi:hypothetical protein
MHGAWFFPPPRGQPREPSRPADPVHYGKAEPGPATPRVSLICIILCYINQHVVRRNLTP